MAKDMHSTLMKILYKEAGVGNFGIMKSRLLKKKKKEIRCA